MATLQADPQWADAAQALIEGCVDLRHDEDRVALLGSVCDALGDELYPAFLRVLWLVGRHGDHGARAAVAQALVHGLRTGRLPSGRRGAFGAQGGLGGAPGTQPGLGGGFGARRLLGPLEYLCAWHAQGEGGDVLSRGGFEAAAGALLDLIAASPEARSLYCEKLLAEADDPLGGALSRPARAGLKALAGTWQRGASSAESIAQFLAALRGPALGSLSALASQRPLAAR